MLSTSPPAVSLNDASKPTAKHQSSCEKMSTNASDNNESQDNTTKIITKNNISESSAVSGDTNLENNVGTPKKKNARKREKLKKLQITSQNVCLHSNPEVSFALDDESFQIRPSTSQEVTNQVSKPQIKSKQDTKNYVKQKNKDVSQTINERLSQFHVSPKLQDHTSAQRNNMVNEYFVQQVIPLYATANTRYLENLSHHPQFQFTQNVTSQQLFNHYRQTSSAPNSPSVLGNMHLSPISFPNSPYIQSNLHSPKFLQNVMQHPLLNHSINSGRNFNMPNGPNNGIHFNEIANMSSHQLTPNRKNGKKDQKSSDQKYENYISKEDVENGLQNNTLLEGVLRINPKQFQHAYVSSSDRSEQDVLIDGVKNRNRALEGDVVIVQFLDNDSEENKEESKQKKGKVVYIKEKVHLRNCIGILKLMPDKNRQRALFIPRDYRMPRLNIPCTFWPDNFYNDSKRYENTLFLAKIMDWFDTRFAIGKIVCNIGETGDIQSETQAILAQTDIDVKPFGLEVRHLYPNLDYVIPEEEIKLREDCRNMCIFSIDPYNCRDIDDAISCRVLENGNYELGVHISDVSHFLTEDTILDEKVAEKATTVYMVEKAYHMLPDELCTLCSLFPGVDKLAFSIFWEITDDAQVVSTRFSKTVIHSCCQLAYENAQAVLENKVDAESNFPEICNNFKYEDVNKTIKILGKISSILRRRRFEGGALRIDQPKVSFHLSPKNGMPESFWIYESKESHQLIEEFMLLANMSVAQKIYEDYPQLAFLRCHPEPSGYMLRQLEKSLKPMGIDLEISSAGDLHKSLLPYVGPSNTDKGKAMVLSMLCAKPMARAKYFCAGGSEEDFHHYALNVPLYTHFTSPIRRYADIMVHRLLSASIKYREVPKWEIDKVRMVAAQCNKQKYNAKRAGELSTELYTLKYIEMNSPLTTEAVVVEVREKYIDVIVVAMGLNRRIFFNNDFPGEYKCIKNDAGMKLSKMELTWHATDNLPQVKQIISVFTTIQVEMHKGDDMVKVETKLVRPLQLDPTL
ncbi:DIS3-like exonuclease 2 [Zerene cesonia]|uniref:DIS3-like exonuclease 2 n=1 Tax=Zerene cesonia TaxID=33412 RepID=UPI0018E51273|nr:DIS3-like exonuclease 2 [Zerene cesonia]